jgi:hypothetical protein
MNSAQLNIQDGWVLHVCVSQTETWLGVVGPQGQMAAFEAPRDSVRAEVLRNLLVDIIAIAATPNPQSEPK